MSKHTIKISVPQKSISLAIILTVFFGPLGLFYATFIGGLIMFLITLIVSLLLTSTGFIFTWPICVAWAISAVKKYNSETIEEKI